MPAISGVARDASNNPTEKLVRVYRRDTGEMAGQAVSNATTGAYSISTRDTSEHTAVLLSGSLSTTHVADIVLSCPMTGNTADNTSFIDSAGHMIQNPHYTKVVRRDLTSSISGTPVNFGYVAWFRLGNFLRTAPDADFVIGTNDLTMNIEFFVNSADGESAYANSHYPVCLLSSHAPAVAYKTQSAGFALWVDNTGEITLRWNGADHVALIYPNIYGRWPSITISRKDGDIHMFVDNAWAGTFADSSSMAADQIFIGSGGDGAGQANAFYARNLLVINGTGLFDASVLPSSGNILDVISGGTENAVILDRVVPV